MKVIPTKKERTEIEFYRIEFNSDFVFMVNKKDSSEILIITNKGDFITINGFVESDLTWDESLLEGMTFLFSIMIWNIRKN